MLAMIPRAGELARKGKPAMLRLVARWFRMPAPHKKSERDLEIERDSANTRASSAERNYEIWRQAADRLQAKLDALEDTNR